MDIVGGPFSHLIPSDQLDDSLLLGQNLECEASEEFEPGRNQPDNSLKNMLSDKDPMFGSASTQFHLLENEDVNFKLESSTDVNQDTTTGGVRQSPSDGEHSQPSFPQGRTRNASQIQRKQTASRGRVRGAPGRRIGPQRRAAQKNQDQEATSERDESLDKKREALLSRRFKVHEVDSSMNPVVVLRRLTVTVGGYKIELLPGPSQTFGSFNASALQSLGFQDDSMIADGIGLNLEQNQNANTENMDNFTPDVVGEVSVGQPSSDDMPMDFGPYVNPNEVQEANSTMLKPTVENAAPGETKTNDQIKSHKPSAHKSLNKNGTAVLPAVKKVLKHKPTLSGVKNKQSHPGRPSLLQNKSLHPKDKKMHVGQPENLQSHKGKPAKVGLKRPGGPLTPQPSKVQKTQDGHPVHPNVSPPVPASPTVSRKPSSDSGPSVKPVLNKSQQPKKPQNPPTPVNKTNPPVTNSQADEEPEKMKIKKPEKIQQRHKSRNSRSISIDEPQLFIPDNAPVVKKEAEGEPPAENDAVWDPSKHCGLCKKPHNNRFMVGCGRCDDWFHGDCVGLDLAKVQQMEKEDQEYVCLKCCADENGKTGAQSSELSAEKLSPKQKHRPQQMVTAGGIRPFRKDVGDRRPSEDSPQKSGASVKHETKKIKVSSVSSKKPSTGQIRRSVRDSLEEIFLKRLKESDLKISLDKPAELARRTEKELFALFQGVDSKYKNKYRSLTFNLKDAKNNVLFKRVLKGEVSPADLVRMTAEELASKELAAWRQRENRHTIEMIEKEQREAERRPITKITHKGEIEIENQEPAKAPEAIEAEPEPPPKAKEVPEHKPLETVAKKANSPKKSIDTTSLHKSHLFDLNCKICTGRMPPPSEEPSTKVVKVATTVVRRQSSATDESQQSTTSSSALIDDLSLRAMEEGLLNFLPETRSDSLSNKEDTATFLSNLESLWGGFVDMHAVARFLTKVYPVSGILDHLPQDLPENIQVGGRISPQIVWDYVEKIRASGTKEICVIRFTPDTEEDDISYALLYAYFSSRRRYGVVANNRKQVKDMYLIPLGSTEKIPHQIVPFDGPGLETSRPNLLLGLIIRQRPKRDFGVILPSDVSKPPSFLAESKTQVDFKQKDPVVQDVETSLIGGILGTSQEKETADLIVNEPTLDTETDENVSLRFLPGVLKVPGNTTSGSNNVKDDSTATALKTSTVDGGNHAGNIPKTPSSAPRLDRFIIKKKDSKSVKTEPNSGQENSSEGREKEINPQSRTVLSLSDKPADVSTESFLSSLATTKPKEESSADLTSSTAAPARPESTTSNASQDPVTESSCSVPKNETVSSPTTTSKVPPSGILKKTSTDKDSSELQPPVSTSETSQQPPAQLLQECKAVEDIQAITTISSTGKNEGLKPSRTPIFNPTVYNPSQAPPPSPVFPSYNTGAPDHQYHPAPVHNYPPSPNPAPFIPVQPQAPPPFTFPVAHPPIQIFHQSDLQSRTIAPPWPQTVPPQMPPGPPPTYETQRLPESSLPAPSSVSKDEKESEKYYGDKPSRRSEETYKKEDRDHYDRHHHKSRHHDRDREKHRERSHSHKDRHSKDDRYERSRERHHSSHHRDRDKHKRDSDYDKHKKDTRDRRS